MSQKSSVTASMNYIIWLNGNAGTKRTVTAETYQGAALRAFDDAAPLMEVRGVARHIHAPDGKVILHPGMTAAPSPLQNNGPVH